MYHSRWYSIARLLTLAECQALADLYNSTNGPGWVDNTGWLATNTLCSTPWHGVTCSGGRVTYLGRSSNQLTGSIPASLGNLGSLGYLNLAYDQLTGSIPASLANLSELRGLSLSVNQLTGGIPASLGNLGSLKWLSLDHNHLTGSVPDSLGNLGSMEQLLLDTNPLSGPLPQSLTSLTLRSFYFNHTGLCEPPDTAFQAWLASIADLLRTGVRCPEMTATPTDTPTPTPTATRTVTPAPTATATASATPELTPTRTPPAPPVGWDRDRVAAPRVIVDGGSYRMYYQASR